MATLEGLHHVALSVSDVDASSTWYRELFGLEETFRQESETRRVVVMQFPGLRHTLGLVQHHDVGDRFRPENLGLDNVAFTVGSRPELEEWSRRFDDLGMTHSGLIETPFGGMLNFEGPDGIAHALFWERGYPAASVRRSPDGAQPTG